MRPVDATIHSNNKVRTTAENLERNPRVRFPIGDTFQQWSHKDRAFICQRVHTEDIDRVGEVCQIGRASCRERV